MSATQEQLKPMLEIIRPRSTPPELTKGTSIVASEYPNGRVRHTVISADQVFVKTEEVPEGFRRVFILEVEGEA